MTADGDTPISSSDAARVIGKTSQTIRNWTTEFEAYFSPLATMDSRNRLYTPDDLEVLTLIKAMRDRNFRPEEIEEALERGERVELDTMPRPPKQTISSNQNKQLQTQQLQIELKLTQDELERTQGELKKLQAQLTENQAIREEKIRLETRLEVIREQYEAQITTLREQIEQTRSFYQSQIDHSASSYQTMLEQRQADIEAKNQQVIALLREIGAQREQLGKYYAQDERQQSNLGTLDAPDDTPSSSPPEEKT